ncbi:hypothetical protein GCM10023080_064890 [Streptomyces pseudoechinosporeus]
MTTIDGEVEAGFEPVREAFAANFARRGDIGAAVCVYRDGRPAGGGPLGWHRRP